MAVGKDAQTVFICRFFSGFFGACPLTIVGAVFADMFSNRQRGLAITVFSIAVFAGPLLAPFIGGFIVDSYLGWRWTEWITSFMGFLGLGLLLVFLEETYAPALLVSKAADLRRRTKNWYVCLCSAARKQLTSIFPRGIHAKQEEIEIDLRELIEKNLSRPMRMLFTEPIVFLLSIYVSVSSLASRRSYLSQDMAECANELIDGLHLRPPLSLPHILPNRLPANIRLLSRRWRSPLLRHDPG